MRGYTPETKGIDDIDFDFIHELSGKCPAKIIAEGHIHYPEQAKKALEAGAFALVVGGAITRPELTAILSPQSRNKGVTSCEKLSQWDIGGTAIKAGLWDGEEN